MCRDRGDAQAGAVREILRSRAERAGCSSRKASSRRSRTVLAFCGPLTTTTCLARTTSTSPSQIRKFDLHTGDTVSGQIRPPKDGERYFALIKVEAVNFEPPGAHPLEDLLREPDAAFHPQRRVNLEAAPDNLSARVMDLMVDRQRAARPHRRSPANREDDAAQNIANSITTNHPEVPDRAAHRRAAGRSHGHAAVGQGEVISSTFDDRPRGTSRWPRW